MYILKDMEKKRKVERVIESVLSNTQVSRRAASHHVLKPRKLSDDEVRSACSDAVSPDIGFRCDVEVYDFRKGGTRKVL